MRVLHVFKTYYPDTFGGIEQVIRQVSIATHAHGVSNRVFTLSREAKKQPMIRDGTIDVIRAPLSLELASTPVSLSAVQTFRQAVADCDLIHYHFPWPFGDLLHLLAAQGKPSMLTYHADVVRQRWLMPVYDPLMRRFLSGMRALVPTSPNYLESSPLLQQYRQRSQIIPIGLNEASYPKPEEQRVKQWRAQLGNAFFLFVGVLRYYKGLHILLDACVGSTSRVVILGAGPVEADLKQQAARLGLTNVHFLGAVSDEDKVALLELCRGVVFPSHLRAEAFGVTLLEGAMYSKPLISAEIATGSSYVNIDGVTGIVVAPNDVDGLRVAMQRLDADPDLCSAMGQQARARFDALFTAAQMGQAYFDLYQTILENRV
jgi:glycosyltransferase involved in cell wall biosynthesis